MPNTHTTLTSLFDDIADAIRAKTGGSSDIVADNFPTAIAAIPTGGVSLTSIVKCSPEKESVSQSTTGSVTATYTFDKVANAKYYIIVRQAGNISNAIYTPTLYAQYIALFDGTSIVSQTGQYITYVGEENNQYTFASSASSPSGSQTVRVTLYAYAIL